ncbi:hypothetical protein ACIBHX_26395 [Nonomuraea sp. NPDC050536]|uniref:hypothetical protein n=1 Tax=Nonomuraea sp. NPDC050536 TaxID=3364366 RepID=UPI0037CC2F0E
MRKKIIGVASPALALVSIMAFSAPSAHASTSSYVQTSECSAVVNPEPDAPHWGYGSEGHNDAACRISLGQLNTHTWGQQWTPYTVHDWDPAGPLYYADGVHELAVCIWDTTTGETNCGDWVWSGS